MCLHEEAVGAVAAAARAMVSINFGVTAGDAARSVRLLQRMGAVYYHGAGAGFLHQRHAAEVYNEVAVAERCATVGDGYIIVAAGADFVDGEAHRFGREELAFLDVYGLSCTCCGREEVGLAAEKRRYLEYVCEAGSHYCFLRLVDVGDHGHAEFTAYGVENGESLEVAYAAERVEAAAVSLSVAAFEDKRDVEARAYLFMRRPVSKAISSPSITQGLPAGRSRPVL